MLHENPVVAQLPPSSLLKAIDPALMPSSPAVGKSALALKHARQILPKRERPALVL